MQVLSLIIHAAPLLLMVGFLYLVYRAVQALERIAGALKERTEK